MLDTGNRPLLDYYIVDLRAFSFYGCVVQPQHNCYEGKFIMSSSKKNISRSAKSSTRYASIKLSQIVCDKQNDYCHRQPDATGFEPVTFGSGGGRRFCPKLNESKELRLLARGEVLAVVLSCLPLIGAYCISLHRSRIFGTLPMLSMQHAK